MMNVLIALMTNKYSDVYQDADAQTVYERCVFLIDYGPLVEIIMHYSGSKFVENRSNGLKNKYGIIFPTTIQYVLPISHAYAKSLIDRERLKKTENDDYENDENEYLMHSINKSISDMMNTVSSLSKAFDGAISTRND